LADRRRHGWIIGLVTAIGLVPAAVGCATASQGINARLASVQSEIDQALDDDQLERAYELAVEFEYRLPGGDSFATLGEVLWRRGDLIDAEAMHRRAVDAGVPRGYLGLARAALARSRWDEAESAARRAAELPATASQAMMLLAAVEWGRGRPHAAAQALAVTSAEASPLTQEAALIAAVGPPDDDPGGEWRSPLQWRGETATLALAAGAIVEARIGGLPASLRILLDGTRSSISPQLAMRTGAAGVADGDAIGAPLTLDALRTPSAPFRVRTPEGPEDGVLGFDLLSTLGWAIDLRAGSMTLWAAPAAADGVAGPLLARTHWATVRIPRRGIEAQLLVLPRLRGQIVRATLDLSGRSRVGSRALAQVYRDDEPPGTGGGDPLALELRLGGWGGRIDLEIADLTPLAAGGRVAPQAVLGADVLADWRIWWRPDYPDLRFERHPESAPAPDLPLQ
jgi:hypothetical protein